MKKIITFAAAVVSVLSVAFFAVNSSAADSLQKQDISYNELVGRVSQSDSGFTISSKYVYSGGMKTDSAPLSGSDTTGFQFYYLGLERWSSNNTADYNPNGKDSAIDDWYLKWLDSSLANLRRNGGSCIIRACYALNGESNAEPSDFSLVEQHQKQLAEVFAKYSDVIVGVECGMAGQYGEMHHGRYSDEAYKGKILDNWLKNLPESITVNVRTLDEYIYYINNSDVYSKKYMNKTVSGTAYPAEITRENCAKYLFENEVFNRIGFYNDGMIQDSNDADTFYSSRADFVSLLNSKADETSYGGEFSSAAGEYRVERTTWLPMKVIPEFYNVHLAYYHGGNAAYESVGKFKSGGVSTREYDDSAAAAKKAAQFEAWCEELGSGMSYSTSISGNTVTYNYGGWSSAKMGDELFEKLRTDANVTADLSAYKDKSVAAFFEDHLGYRLVLKESYLTEKVKSGGELTVKGTIDNTGFADISRDKVSEIILSDNSDGDNMYILRTDLDVNSWVGGSTNDYEMTLTLPKDIAPGKYEVYLRIASEDTNGITNPASCIRFANPGNFTNKVQGSTFSVSDSTVRIIYNPNVCGNYIGTFTVN